MNLGGVELDASQVLGWVEETHRVAYKVKKIREDTLDMSFCRYCERCWWDKLNQKTIVIEFFATLNRKELDFYCCHSTFLNTVCQKNLQDEFVLEIFKKSDWQEKL